MVLVYGEYDIFVAIFRIYIYIYMSTEQMKKDHKICTDSVQLLKVVQGRG